MLFRAGELHYHHPILCISYKSNTCYILRIYPSCRKQCFSSSSESTQNDFAGKNAYDVLGVSETSSLAEIKASFRKLAKETHPDLARSDDDPSASQRFVQILAAYEILSDSEKRAHYDMYLFSQRKVVQRHSKQGSTIYTYGSHITITTRQMEVVEWLKWYRSAVNDILSQKNVVVGSSYFDVLEGEFYSAIHAAYYGPVIESVDLLPDCFEAEERSVYETPEVLHLVSGRDLFGIVYLIDKVPKLSHACNENLFSFISEGSGMCHMQVKNASDHASDVYKDLELHVSGRLVAVATRMPPKSYLNDGIQNEDSQDHIHVFLSSHEDSMYSSKGFSVDSFSGSAVGSRILLGSITGLGTNPEEGSCFVYNNRGTKTHVIMKHRTLLVCIILARKQTPVSGPRMTVSAYSQFYVKHMHWYQVGDKVSVCECRCSRAQLPPSKFWLFEPRCSMHDIGGWYVETFGRDKKGKTVPSQRHWDGCEAIEQPEKRLHPAMYLLALAYRTLDLEDAKRRKQTVRNIVEPKLFRILSWCKKLV
ncbi:hypothetical protein HHK36_002696 [Tetracentron sinense]|uniref:J domain-containing protein n=1 Tax=Tetracentron sinense TaxID=13715 RepID=A0A834ZLY9_TETSI|nr:hypothetical protein HHK36_002696 [Tetracentron sinense]